MRSASLEANPKLLGLENICFHFNISTSCFSDFVSPEFVEGRIPTSSLLTLSSSHLLIFSPSHLLAFSTSRLSTP